jgi:hypothetical protein
VIDDGLDCAPLDEAVLALTHNDVPVGASFAVLNGAAISNRVITAADVHRSTAR